MPMMICPFDQQIISLTGHSPIFEANVPTWVPDAKGLTEECLARGVKVYDGPPPAPVETQLDDAAPKEKSDNGNDAKAEYAVALDGALMRILMRDDPNDLSAQLVPKVTKVTAEMSPDLQRPTATEISDAYQRLQENIDLAE